MTKRERIYATIDLKSFYASVECVERGLNPMTTHLVVADAARSEKTICLAVSPSLKAYGIPGRARLFEVVQRVKEINSERKWAAPHHQLEGASFDVYALKRYPELALDYIAAVPRMALYLEYSARIYSVYLKYIAPEDIHVYSIDEVFLDLTDYLHTYHKTARELVKTIIQDIYQTTGITATAGLGTNLYLSKVAMDIMAKRTPADEDGVRIAELDEIRYRRELWPHRPITDFWRVGKGYARKLEEKGLYTMGDIARCSLGTAQDFHNEDLLYKLFGINAELLIDHAWGYEPCTMADIKAYKPERSSVGSGQVLHTPYTYEKAKLVVQEMTELLVLDLVEKQLLTNQIVLTVGYDIDNPQYHGDVTIDYYGRKVPKHAHGTENLAQYTSSARLIVSAMMQLYERIVDKNLMVRRVNLTAGNIIEAQKLAEPVKAPAQMSLFQEEDSQKTADETEALEKEKQLQQAVVALRQKFGKNAVLKGINLEEGATAQERNRQIGGHKA
jgi:DNA polymerase V